ncbi:MAG: hypothetical protein ACI4VX_03865 [Succinivibrionaceae bacterium]
MIPINGGDYSMLRGNVQGNIPDCNNMKENDVDGDQEFPGGKTLPAYLTGSFVSWANIV